MGGIPEDIKKGILGLAKSSGKDAKELVGELKEIIAEDSTIQSMEKTEFKVRYGYAILLNRYRSTFAGTAEMYIKPFSKPRARNVKIKGVARFISR